MKKFEYSVEGADIRNYRILCEYLETKGQQGWELVNWQLSYNMGKEMEYSIKSAIFKREVSKPTIAKDDDPWEKAIKENGFVESGVDNLTYQMSDNVWEYVLSYEGYAYVLYKMFKHQMIPICDFTESNKFNEFIKTIKR